MYPLHKWYKQYLTYANKITKKIIKEIKADKLKQDIWHGAVYIRKLEDYKDMGISLTETGEMQVTGTIGFFSRTVEWIRTDKVPST